MTTSLADATIVTDALLKSGSRAAKAQAALAQSDVLDYALKEVRHGPFGNFVYAHNLLAETRSMAKTRERVAALSLQQYKKRTAQEALDQAANDLEGQTLSAYLSVLGTATTMLGMAASADAVLADHHRRYLSRVIHRAERELHSLRKRAIDPLACFVMHPLKVERDGQIDDGVRKCVSTCSLVAQLGPMTSAVATLAGVVAQQPQKRENVKRLDALKFVAAPPGTVSSADPCRALGDAVYALRCPAGGTIITTNVTDHAPLAAALGKNVKLP